MNLVILAFGLFSLLALNVAFPTTGTALSDSARPEGSAQLLNSTLGTLLGGSIAGNFTRAPADVPVCYSNKLNVNIFNESLLFGTVAKKYYTAFPTKDITASSLSNLLNSTEDIISRCLNLYSASTMRFGFTEMSDEDFINCGCLNGDN